nr:hypothetical protein CFP56_20449 [Quercus suber]
MVYCLPDPHDACNTSNSSSLHCHFLHLQPKAPFQSYPEYDEDQRPRALVRHTSTALIRLSHPRSDREHRLVQGHFPVRALPSNPTMFRCQVLDSRVTQHETKEYHWSTNLGSTAHNTRHVPVPTIKDIIPSLQQAVKHVSLNTFLTRGFYLSGIIFTQRGHRPVLCPTRRITASGCSGLQQVSLFMLSVPPTFGLETQAKVPIDEGKRHVKWCTS